MLSAYHPLFLCSRCSLAALLVCLLYLITSFVGIEVTLCSRSARGSEAIGGYLNSSMRDAASLTCSAGPVRPSDFHVVAKLWVPIQIQRPEHCASLLPSFIVPRYASESKYLASCYELSVHNVLLVELKGYILFP